MFNWNHALCWLLAAAWAIPCLPVPMVVAEEAASDEASAAEIDALVEQLDADSFAERQAATDRLAEIGKPAIEALAKAAVGESLEVIVRAIDVLKDLMESDDTATGEAAKAALDQVAASDRAAAARRAADALKAAEAKRAPAPQRFAGGIQIAAGGARKVSVRTVNGVKTIEVDEADRTVKITEDPKDGIKMEVTSKKDGKDVTDRYEAKNAEELKKQHPDAYEIYTRYNQMGGAGAFAVQLQVGNVQGFAPIQRPNPIDTATRMLPSWGMALERMATDEAIRDASKESQEALKRQVGEVRERLERLEKRLQEAMEKAEEPADAPVEDPPGEEQ